MAVRRLVVGLVAFAAFIPACTSFVTPQSFVSSVRGRGCGANVGNSLPRRPVYRRGRLDSGAGGLALRSTIGPGNALLPVSIVTPSLVSVATSLVGGIMIAISVAKYAPQIRRIMRSRSVQGLAPAAYYGDSLVFLTKSAYHFRRGHPVSAWGELMVLFAQNAVIIGLLHKFTVPKPGAKLTTTLRVVRDIAALVAFIFFLAYIPDQCLPFLSVFTAPLLIASYSAQFRTNMRRKSTGQLSRGTVLLRLFGSTIRGITTMTQLGGDLPVLINHSIGIIGCSTLLGQFFWYNRDNAATSSEYAAKLVVGMPVKEMALSMSSATLMWRSLGGFETEEKAMPSKRKLRAAFRTLDKDNSGYISTEELASALLMSNPEVSKETAQRMIFFASQDKLADNTFTSIDFNEFEAIVTSNGIQCE